MSVVLLCSCDEDFLSTTIEIEEPEFENLLVVNKFINQDTFENEFYIGENYGILSPNTFGGDVHHVSGADFTVTRKSDGAIIKSEEDLIVNVQEPPSTNHYFSQIPDDFYRSNEEYVFKAEHPDYPISETTLRYPRKVEIYDIKFEFEGGVDDEGDEASSITFKFDDPAGEENFYDISVYLMRIENNSLGYRSRYIFCPDVIAEPSDNGGDIIFQDISFDGTTKELELRVSRRQLLPNEQYVVRWSTTTKDQYLFNFI